MPAYLVSIQIRRCAEPACTARATKELRTTRNEPVNAYCSRHAERALRHLQQLDAEFDRSREADRGQ